MITRHSCMSLLCAFGVTIVGTSMPSLAEEVPQAVQDAAKLGLQSYLDAIVGHEADYGFQPGDVNLQLDSPFELCVIHPDALTSYKPGDDPAKLLSKTTEWFFPVTSADNYRSILVVDKMAGQWKAVSLGRAPLARQLGLIRQQWPESKGYHPRLVVVFQAQKYLFTMPELPNYNLTPISCKETSNTTGKVASATGSAAAVTGKYAHLEQDVGKVVDELKSQVDLNLGQ